MSSTKCNADIGTFRNIRQDWIPRINAAEFVIFSSPMLNHYIVLTNSHWHIGHHSVASEHQHHQYRHIRNIGQNWMPMFSAREFWKQSNLCDVGWHRCWHIGHNLVASRHEDGQNRVSGTKCNADISHIRNIGQNWMPMVSTIEFWHPMANNMVKWDCLLAKI